MEGVSMSNIHDSHVDAAENRIFHTMEILVVNEKERRKHTHQLSSSIYRVPKIIRDVSPHSYTPRVVSIGPFNNGNTDLEVVEMNKVTYLFDLFLRLESPPEQTLKACINMVLAKIDRIKACYDGKITKTYADDELATMMVSDACFIIEIIYRSNLNTYETHSTLYKDLLTIYIKQDLLLLENQIPFFVLEDIFGCTIGKLEPKVSLPMLLLSFLNGMNPFQEQLMFHKDAADHTDYDHILGFFQKSYQNIIQTEPLLSTATTSSLTPITYSVSELGLAGLKFQPNRSKEWVLKMELKSSRASWLCWLCGRRTFRMPVLRIEDYTESVLRNLVAYEQCSPEIPSYITSYVFAMASLLHTKEDVTELVDSNILALNNLNWSEQVADMFNSMCKEVIVKDFIYSKAWHQLDDYYNSYWHHNKNVAWLRLTYFSSPWSFIALLAACLLFGLTVAQTYFTIQPV